jgi:hypothetical protein
MSARRTVIRGGLVIDPEGRAALLLRVQRIGFVSSIVL